MRMIKCVVLKEGIHWYFRNGGIKEFIVRTNLSDVFYELQTS
jgi:hypothetical protein